MRTKITFFILIAIAFLSFQAKAQQVIASAGGYYEGDNISLSWTLGEPVTETFSGGGVILTQGFQQPYSFYLQQILNIPAGWSGVSSYIDPMNKGVEGIFAPYSTDFIILASMTQFYYPETGVNTIGNWNYETGYKIKAGNEFEITMKGTKISDPSVDLAAGWNLIPVLSSCEVPVTEVFDGFSALTIVKQVAGPYIYWPAYNINTLVSLVPGKAYFAATSSPGSVTYPGCTKSTLPSYLRQAGSTSTSTSTLTSTSTSTLNKWQDQKPENFTPWNNPHYTASSHAIAFPAEVLENSGIKPGDVIGVFTPEGLCAGFTEITDLTSNTALMSFSNDETTPGKDGFEIGEMHHFKLYRPQSNQEFEMEVAFDPSLPNMGLFENQGLSAVKSITLNPAEILENTGITCEVFPNPSHGNFTLTMSSWPEKLNIYLMDASGRIIKTFIPGTKLNGSGYAFNLDELPKGIYFLKLVDVGFLEIKKIVID
jgi:hypothetical protein